MSVAERIGKLVPASHAHSAAERAAILEIAFLAVSADRKILPSEDGVEAADEERIDVRDALRRVDRADELAGQVVGALYPS